MKKAIVLIGICFMLFSLKAQNVNYNDVAVIVNSNSAASIEIANYFKDKRNIPEVNMVYINCSTEERVDSVGLFSIVDQVGNYLLSSGIFQSVNYLVTTKGIPLIFEGGNCDSIPSSLKCSSIDSELTLVINHEEYIGSSGSFQNPYFDVLDYNFLQSNYGIYLVTRLDGYTVDDVKALIDKSGPDLKIEKTDAQFIFDLAFASDTNAIAPLVGVMEQGDELVKSKGWNSIYSPGSASFVTDEDNVLGYFSYIYQPSNKVLNYEWLKGSIAFQGIGETASTFLEDENTYNDLILANIISEGVCGAAGTVVPYFLSSGTIWPEILFDRYTYGVELIAESNPYFNLAESFYQALKVTSSPHVIVGDPKTSIVLEGSGGDSTVVIQPGPENGKDVSVWEFDEGNNHGDRESLAAYSWTHNDNPSRKRAFLEFDCSEIPNNAIITNANLSLYYNPTDPYESFDEHTGENDIFIQRITSAWDEHSIVWDNQPGTTTEKQVKLPPSSNSTQDYINIDVTGMVREMTDPTKENNGFMINMVDEVNHYKSVLFASSDHVNADLHPKLEICWTIDSTNSIDPEKSKLSFEVYPNPNQGVFTLKLPDHKLADYQLSVFNSMGQRITNYQYSTGQVHLYGKGIFIVMLSDNDGNYLGKKVIVH